MSSTAHPGSTVQRGEVAMPCPVAVWLKTNLCPFKNLPEERRGQLGEGLTAAEMQKCRWLKSRMVATIDYLERTVANHLRHGMFVGLSNKSALRGS
jgi:hypothetical protein